MATLRICISVIAFAALGSLAACGASDAFDQSTLFTDDGRVACPGGTALQRDGYAEPLEWWCEKSDGTLHGPTLSRYAGGRLKETGVYRNGKRDGRWSYWGPDGTLVARLQYKRGKPHGTWLSWYEEGNKWQQQAYRNGVRDGVWVEWWKAGVKREEKAYRAGIPHGRFAWWDDHGVLLRTEVYEQGQLVKTVKYASGVRVVERF